jgi:hypothetical protein
MHCAYCGVDYSFEDCCLCLPPRRPEVATAVPKVDGPWGEAAIEWSLREIKDKRAWMGRGGEA